MHSASIMLIFQEALTGDVHEKKNRLIHLRTHGVRRNPEKNLGLGLRVRNSFRILFILGVSVAAGFPPPWA
jgi:hypothetical protein